MNGWMCLYLSEINALMDQFEPILYNAVHYLFRNLT